MKTVISAAVVGIFLFLASAGVSFWMMPSPNDETAENEDNIETLEDVTKGDDEEKSKAKPIMPVAVRPGSPITLEVATEIAQSIMAKEEGLRKREADIEEKENRLELLFKDLKQEREELVAFHERVEAKIQEAKEEVLIVRQERDALTKQQESLKKLERKTGTDAEDADAALMDESASQIKGLFKEMPPEWVAKYIKNYSNKNQDIGLVAAVLNKLDNREVSQILEFVDDMDLTDEIVEKMATRRSSKKKGMFR